MSTLVPRSDFRNRVHALAHRAWSASIVRTTTYYGYYLFVTPILLILWVVISAFFRYGGLKLVLEIARAYVTLREVIPRLLLRVYTYNSEPHVYRILDQHNSEIRLLKVRSVKSVWGLKNPALVNAELISCPIASAPPFVAVSYRWEANKSMPITINRRRFDVPCGIYELLTTLQSEQAVSDESQDERYLWIDSICINQGDTKEKSWQIGLMKDIYRSATQVLCWLGAVAPPVGTWHGIDKVRDAADIICNDFFFRVWIIQEISLARKIVMRTRTDSCSWSDGVVGTCRDQGPAFALYGENQFGLPAEIMPRLKQGIKNMGGIESFRASLSESPDGISISELLVRSVEFQCSDPRDRVYGLLGLTTEKARSEILVKYHRDYPEIEATLQAVRFSLLSESSFQLLEMSGIGADNGKFSDLRTCERPTWIPDWQSPQINELVETLAHAKSHITAVHRQCCITPPTLSEDHMLCIEGALVDTIQEFITTAMILPKTCDLQDYLSWNHLFPFLDNLDLICKTARETKKDSPRGDDDTHDAIIRTILDAGSWIKEEPLDFAKRYEDLESLSTKLRSRIDNAKYQDFRKSVVKMDFMHFLMGIQEAMPLLIGRRLCRSGNGNFGIAPPGTKEGDVVCAFSGAPNPFVLRPCQETPDSTRKAYQIVGVCYVDKIMKGELEEIDLDWCMLDIV